MIPEDKPGCRPLVFETSLIRSIRPTPSGAMSLVSFTPQLKQRLLNEDTLAVDYWSNSWLVATFQLRYAKLL